MLTNLTIVIPVYNVIDYLEQCLASLPKDSVKIIIVNDGSTDGSDVFCEKYVTANNNAILINKSNGGLSDARNAALPHISTEYVFFLDSDDYLDAQKLNEALCYATDNNLDWLQCGYAYDYPSYLLIHNKYTTATLITKDNAIHSLVTNSYIKNFAWGKIYKTEMIRDITFPIGKFFEDAYWQYQVLTKCNRIGIFPAITTYYRQRSGSISERFSIRNLDLLEGLLKRLRVIEHDNKFLLPTAAFHLWVLSDNFVSLAKKSANESMIKKYELFNEYLLSNYSIHIHKGIDSQNPFWRLYYNSVIKKSKWMPMLDIASKVAGKFSTPSFSKVIKNA